MKAFVYYPKTEESIKELEKRVCDVHIDFVKTKVASLNIPTSRKKNMLEEMSKGKI